MNNFDLWQKDAPPLSCTLSQLEKRLKFHYLPRLQIEPKLAKACHKKWKNGLVHKAHLEAGKKFQDAIAKAQTPRVSVRFCSDLIGWGLFTEESLPEGHFAGEYTGRVRKNNEYNCLNNFLYEYPIPDEIGRNHVIDATDGNLMRFVNHSSSPNLKPLYAFSEGVYHLILVTTQGIPKGAELTYDYGQNYWHVRTPPC